jgi:hypothetical protein
MFWPKPWPSNKFESELPAFIRLASLLPKCGSAPCVLSARESLSSEAITWPAALRLYLRAFFAVLATIHHLNLGVVSGILGYLKTYLSASEAVASITETRIAGKVKGQF